MAEDESRPASAAVDKEALKEALAEILAEMPAFKAISVMNEEKEAGSSSKATPEVPNTEASTSGSGVRGKYSGGRVIGREGK